MSKKWVVLLPLTSIISLIIAVIVCGLYIKIFRQTLGLSFPEVIDSVVFLISFLLPMIVLVKMGIDADKKDQ